MADELLEFLENDGEPSDNSSSKTIAADGHMYYKSKSANATEAPTNAGTHNALQERLNAVTAGLTPHQADFLLMCQMYFNIYGVLIPVEVAVKRYGITEEMYESFLNQEPVQDALLKNNIIKPEVTETPLLPKASVLTPFEIVVCNTMMDLIDTRSDKKKLQDLSCSTQEWQRMMRKPQVQEYLQELGESILQGGQHEAALALMDRVRSGDLRAITYLHEYTGKYQVQPSGSSTTVNIGSPGSADLNYIVTQLIEIIIEEVTDVPTAMRVGDRVKQLIGAHKVAQQLISAAPPITDPGVAPMRDQTDVITAIETRAGVQH